MATEPEVLSEDEQYALLTKGTALADPEPIKVELPTEAATEAQEPPAAATDGATPPAAAAVTETQAEPFPGFASLPEDVRAEYAKIKARADAAEKLQQERDDYASRWRAQHGQLAPTQRKVAELERALKEREAAIPKPGEKFGKWAEQLPEDSAAILDLVAPLKDELTQLRTELAEAKKSTARLHEERELAKLSAKHPDFEDIVFAKTPDGKIARQENGSPYWTNEFYDWWTEQPENVRELVNIPSADNLSRLLTYYKGERALHAPPPAATPATVTTEAANTTQRRQRALQDTEPPIRAQQSTRNAPLSDEDAQWVALTSGNPRFVK